LLGGVSLLAALYVALSLWGRRRRSARGTAAHWTRSFLLSVLFNTILLGALPWSAHKLLPGTLPIPSLVGISTGIVLVLLGLAGLIYCVDAFGRRGQGTPSPLDAPSRLVTHGLFRVVRNPIIVSELTVIWGEALYFASLGIAIYAIVVSLIVHLEVVFIEEPELRKRFGQSYDAYCLQVGRWFPRLGPKPCGGR
jgi:protein-S-isoprenylcysteine O-methyltransferase Ste14